MRISTSMIYQLGVGALQQQTSSLVTTQQQLAQGKRMLTPADDPVAAAQLLNVAQSLAVNQQYGTNQTAALNSLQQEENVLGAITSVIQDVKTMAVAAGNPVLSDSDRLSMATELQGKFEMLLGLANSTDGTGQFMFAGYQGATSPFSLNASGSVIYNGDRGQRLIGIGPSRQIPTSDSGSEIFQNIKNGNGTFVTAPAPNNANTGSGVISPGIVLDKSKWAASQQDYRIVFAVDNTGPTPVTTYDIIDASNNSLITGQPSEALASGAGGPRYPRVYTSDSAISFKQLPTDPGQPQYPASQPAGFGTAGAWDIGIETTISGNPAGNPAVATPPPPANVDVFTVKASTNQEDLFATISNMISVLKMPAAGSASSQAAFRNGLNTAMSNLNNGLDHILTIRASVGARMKEIDTVQNVSQDRELQYQQVMSQLQDLDYAKAITDLTKNQTSLEAAQKSFLKVQGLSLFNYM